MKKLFLTISAFFLLTSLVAQVKLEENNLKAALEKAKAENKMVMVIGSATW